ncbi:MAG: DUF1223 domain-containing protein [Gammaproteobacteria bacterium]|nr:DUF1223 domain-containing protein [Gammaproteobacteria bacterium]
MSLTVKAGVLKVKLDGRQLTAEYDSNTTSENNMTLNIAILGMNLKSQITAGENEGRIARHEFVVVGFKSISSTTSQWKTTLPPLHYSHAMEYALAVWVNKSGDPSPLQALGGKLPGNTFN